MGFAQLAVRIRYRLKGIRAQSALGLRTTFIERFLLIAYSILERGFSRITAASGGALFVHARYRAYSTLRRKYAFVRLDDLVSWTRDWVKSLPRDFDVIVGIPRGGLIVAGIIACKFGKPLTTPELFRLTICDETKSMNTNQNRKSRFEKVLLVDDTMNTGGSVRRSVEILRSCQKDLKVQTAILMVTKYAKGLPDFYYKVMPDIKMTEWNLADTKMLGKLASDLDGVICENCPAGVDSNDDSRDTLYRGWIRKAKPNLIPTFEIDAIVSQRLEKYRAETEQWLTRHGVRYKELYLWDIKSKRDRGPHQKWVKQKISVLYKIKPDFFWESSYEQARAIWHETKIPTLCFDELCLFG